MKSEQSSETKAWRGASWEQEPAVPRRLDDIRALEQAIMQDARDEAEQILGEARTRAESIRAQAESQASAERDTILQRARRDAAILHEQAVAAAQIEAQTLKLRRREQLLARVFNRVREQLTSVPQWPNYEQIASHLVREALEHLDTDHAIVRTDAQTRKVLTNDVLAGLASELGVYLRPGEPLTRGTGVILETPDGHRRYDNTLETRLTRLQDTLRTMVYHILMGETP